MASRAIDNEQEKQDSRVELLSEKRQKAQGRLSWSSITLDTWILEGASLGFSIACLVAIYGILIAYNGKRRPEFDYSISLNAIISILATACKSSLVFVVGVGLSQLKWLWFQNRQQLSSIQGEQSTISVEPLEKPKTLSPTIPTPSPFTDMPIWGKPPHKVHEFSNSVISL